MVRSNYLSLVLFTINAAVNSETGFRPLDAKFGSEDGLRDLALHQRNPEVFHYRPNSLRRTVDLMRSYSGFKTTWNVDT